MNFSRWLFPLARKIGSTPNHNAFRRSQFPDLRIEDLEARLVPAGTFQWTGIKSALWSVGSNWLGNVRTFVESGHRFRITYSVFNTVFLTFLG